MKALRILLAIVFVLETRAVFAATAPRFANYSPDAPLGRSAGEPSLGASHDPLHNGRVMYIAGVETLGLDFDECTSPPQGLWGDFSFVLTNQETLDPILFTDRITGRTFVSQLLFPTKQSAMAFSDDEGQSWTVSQGSGVNTGVDHQTVGGGPFPFDDPIGPLDDYPHAVYYCAQDVGDATCALSRDGGVTFGPGMVIYNVNQCDGLHGHIKVAPDGTAYVPNSNCLKALGDPLGTGEPGVVRSSDSGLTWQIRTIPGRNGPSAWDPGVDVGAAGRLYFGWEEEGQPMVAVSSDRGDNWTHVQDVGAGLGINWIAFPQMTAGDDNRAAFAFLGTDYQGPGDPYGEDAQLPAVWYLYVALTYDGGQTWTTVNATPGDPVQRGTICGAGLGCGSTRNLLDFNDVNIDRQGRVIAAYADGCVGGCLNGPPNSGTAVAAVALQVAGRGLLSAFDPDGTEPPSAVDPRADLYLAENEVRLTWEAPHDRGSAITGYKVYRRAEGAAMQILLATLPATARGYTDTTITAGVDYFYEVTALNANGEGARCREVAPEIVIPIEHCDLPGAEIAADPAGDAPTAALDVLALHVAEPAQPDEVDRLVFTLQVDDLSLLQAGNAWVILWNRPYPDTEFDRNYVAMRATGPNTAQFTYGRVSPPNANQGTDLGAADSGSFAADGTIRIAIARDKVDAPPPGTDLSALEVRTFVANVSGQPVTQLSAADFTAPGIYPVVGNRFCDPRPLATDDLAATPEGRAVDIDVLANDTDSDDEPLAVDSLGAPSHGSVALNPDGTVRYTPAPHFAGLDSFTYEVRDPGALTDLGSVTVTVFRVPPTQQPVEQNDTPDNNVEVDEDGDFTLAWTFPGAPQSQPCGFRVEEATGTLELFTDDAEEPLVAGENATWDGDEQWISSVHPDTGTPGYQVVYTNEIDVQLAMKQPVQLPDGPSQILFTFDSFEDIEEDFDFGLLESSVGEERFRPLASFTGSFSGRRVVDVSHLAGLPVRFRFRFISDQLLSTPPFLGWSIDNIRIETADFQLAGTTGAATLQHALTGRADGDYIYRIAGLFGAACDQIGPYSNLRSLTVDRGAGEPLPPSALDDLATTTIDVPVTIDVLANDTDPNGDALVVDAVTQPAHGSVANNGSDVTYTPSSGFTGSDAFSYTACDPGALCDTATVSVSITSGARPQCELPGLEAASDPAGDTTAVAGGDPSLDLLSLSVSEPFLGAGVEKLVLTIQVVDFTTPHPSAAWRAVWKSPDEQFYFVSLENCNALTGPTCSYGTFDGTVYSSVGDLEDCAFDADGTMTLGVDKNLVGIADGANAGEPLTDLAAESQVFLGALCSGALSTTDEAIAPEPYTLFTNAACECPAPAAVTTLSLDRSEDVETLEWSGVDSATSYDVLRGSLGQLRGGEGDFAEATEACVADDVPGPSVELEPDPDPGEGFWFLVRASNVCGNGSYDEPGTPSRDAEIEASGADCP